MDRVSKSPFSLYDFLGYFIPGALFCYLFAIVFEIEEIKWLNIEFFLGLRVFDQSVAFILFSYVFGHAINYLSTLTIEKYSIWSIGYPSKYLFGVKPECYFKKLIDKDDEKEKESYYISIIWRSGLMIVILPALTFHSSFTFLRRFMGQKIFWKSVQRKAIRPIT